MNEHDASAFADRVMSAIEVVTPPTPVRTFGWSLRARSWRDAIASLLVAWHLGTVRTWSVAPSVRARSIALVLAVSAVLATGSIVGAAALRVAVPDDGRLPSTTTPTTDVPADPIVDGPEVDDSDHDVFLVPPSPPAQPGAAETEATPHPSDPPQRPREPTGRRSGTSGSSDDAPGNTRDGTASHDGSDDGGHVDDAHDGDSARSGTEESGHGGGGGRDGGDSSDEGRD